MIKNLIEIELGYINTNHPDFIDVISLVKNDKPKKEEYHQMSFDSEMGKEYSEEENIGATNNFKFKKREMNAPAEQTEFLDAKLKDIQTNKVKKEEYS